jgi:D-sedoheptulose 7-phosphate isomerase
MNGPIPTYSIDGYLQATQRVLSETPTESIAMTVYRLFVAWEQKKQVFVLGNGGSASTASHMGNDLSKATIVPGMPRLKVISIADNVALMTAWANDSSYETIFKEQLANLLEPGDVVIGITASGNSPNVLRAMEFANENGAVTIAWTGRSGGRVKDMVDCCVHAQTEDVGMIESIHLVIDHLVTNAVRQHIETRKANADFLAEDILTVASV